MTREGIFKDYHDFLGLKEAPGFDPMPYTFYLKPFLEYCIEMYPEEGNITKEMVDGWLQIRMFRTNATQSHAISNLRAFSRYINSLGRLAYIPSEEYSVPVRRYQPYVFTDYELHTLFNSIDSLAPCSSAPGREFIVPVLFRMMYCCGLRPSEPLHLLTEDINLENGSIYIRQSKMSKDRHIIMSEDLLILCRKYDSMMGIRQWFFQKWDGGPFPTYWMTNQFRICWRNSGLEKHGNPRPYDLRHCFSARTLMRWVDDGRDIMALLPYLSTYMGTKNLNIHSITSIFFRRDSVSALVLIGQNWMQFLKRRIRMKIRDPKLFGKMKDFLTVYLPIIRSRSPNTVAAYKTTMNLYLVFIREMRCKQLADIMTKDFNYETILVFLAWLKTNRMNSVSSRNQRLIQIRQFCRYLMGSDMILFSEYAKIQEIAKEADPKKDGLEYLTIAQTKLVLSQPDTKKKTGLRDKFFISLLYDSGCRDQEILDLTVGDFIEMKETAELHIVGKGRKYRATPISKDVQKLFHEYCRLYHPAPKKAAFLFYTVRNGVVSQMSADNVARFMNKYEGLARESDPDIPHLHPHLFRHTRAVHLYTEGMPLPLVSEWLGHSQMETTTTYYARATTEMKRKAVEKISTDDNAVFNKDEEFKYAGNDEIIRKLYGLS